MTKKQKKLAEKLEKLNLIIRIDDINYNPYTNEGYVMGTTLIDAPDLPSMHGETCISLFKGYTPDQLNEFALKRLGFSINFLEKSC